MVSALSYHVVTLLYSSVEIVHGPVRVLWKPPAIPVIGAEVFGFVDSFLMSFDRSLAPGLVSATRANKRHVAEKELRLFLLLRQFSFHLEHCHEIFVQPYLPLAD
jgi:hypothetical protein